MAERINEPLVQWPDGTTYDGKLDYRLTERAGVWLGWALVSLVLIGVLALPLIVVALVSALLGWPVQ
jgi:hypothetical protein